MSGDHNMYCSANQMPKHLNASYEGDDLFTGDQLRAAVAAERERLLSTEIHSCHADCQRFACVQTRRAVEAEREKVAAWMIERSYATGHGDTTEDLLKELEWQVRESEREACAKLCDSSIHDTYIEGYTGAKHSARRECAAAIRARGETK